MGTYDHAGMITGSSPDLTDVPLHEVLDSNDTWFIRAVKRIAEEVSEGVVDPTAAVAAFNSNV